MTPYVVKTKRLGLRNWNENDIAPFYSMCSDPDVMAYFPKLLSLEECEFFIKRMQNHYKLHGYCYFAVDSLESKKMIGMCGLLHQDFKSPYTPCVDIGWRFAKSYWRKGLATEAASACLSFGFETQKIDEIFAMAPIQNKNSIGVMQKIGMTEKGTFNHPSLISYPSLQECIVYTKRRSYEF